MSGDAVWRLDVHSDGYPACLASLPDPPAVLYGIGDFTLLRPGLAVVGSRRASPYGLACARRFASDAAGWGITVVSGGAAGCDAAAHSGALAVAGRSICVLGCGPDVDYPASSKKILDRMRSGSCVISEFPPGTPPRRWAFPRRNRIIAGLARAVLVVEAGLPSGTFSTADHALDAGREVFAVPGSVHAPGSAGTNRLIRQGATPVASTEDLLDSLAPLFRLAPGAPAGTTGPTPACVEPILALLTAEPLTAEEIAVRLDAPVPSTMRDIGRLEMDGTISRGTDGRFSPSLRFLEGDL